MWGRLLAADGSCRYDYAARAALLAYYEKYLLSLRCHKGTFSSNYYVSTDCETHKILHSIILYRLDPKQSNANACLFGYLLSSKTLTAFSL